LERGIQMGSIKGKVKPVGNNKVKENHLCIVSFGVYNVKFSLNGKRVCQCHIDKGLTTSKFDGNEFGKVKRN